MQKQDTEWQKKICKPHIWLGSDLEYIKDSQNLTVKKKIQLENGQRNEKFHRREYTDGK